MIKTEGKEKNYELIEYVNDVNREYTEVLMELNINGIMDTAYSYGNERLTVERFDGWTGYYTYDPRGSVSGVTGADGYLWQSYRYDAYGNITFGAPQYNNEYTYNAESYNPNLDVQYLRARYYSPSTANFLTEDSYLGDISDPLTLNRYNYVKSSPLNYVDPEGELPQVVIGAIGDFVYSGVGSIIGQKLSGDISWTRVFVDALAGGIGGAVTSLAGFKVGRAVEGAISETVDYVLTQLENGRKVSIAGVISNMLTGAAFESVSDSLQPIVAGIDSFLESFLNGEDVSDSLKSGLFTGITVKLTKTLAKGLEEVSSLLEFGECTETLYMSDASISKEAAEEIQDSGMTSINKTVKKQGEEVTEEMVDEIEESIAGKSKGGSETGIHNPVVDGIRVGSANKPSDGQHGFPDIIDNYAGDAVHTQITGGDGITRDLYQLEGGYKYYDDKILPNQKIDVNGSIHRMDVLDTKITDTVFEWIVEPDGSVSHRRFIPNGKITGYPNQIATGGS